MDILGLTNTEYEQEGRGTNIIDITRNRQVIRVHFSLVQTFDLKIVNQNNNLITTMITDDPQARCLNTVEDETFESSCK